MLHAKKDYDISKIPEDEPVFLLRAQDRLSDMVVRYWAQLNEQYGGSEELSLAAREHAVKMAMWPERKMPD